jgi:hypothetical protein
MLVKCVRTFAAVCAIAIVGLVMPGHALAQGGATVLRPTDTQKLLPQSVYYKGQSAPIQVRNSGGLRFLDGHYMLATLVDTSGYSSDVASKYQAYLITEVPLKIEGHTLPTGAYGAGFIGDDKFVVTDVGGHDVLTVKWHSDNDIKRPMPLQVTTDPDGSYRLYEGRKYVKFQP